MPLPPATTSFPPGQPATLRRSVWLDTPFGDRAGSQRSGPYVATIIPISGGQQVEREGNVVLASDRVYLPPHVAIAASTILTDTITSRSYLTQFVQRWGDVVEVLVTRGSPDL